MSTGGATASNVGDLLRTGAERLRASGSETPRLDAELLLGHAVHADRTSLLAHPEAQVGPTQADAYERSIERRVAGEPVAYIRGIKEFYGLALMADRRALIPRPETELLVDFALDDLRQRLTSRPGPGDAPPLRVWDVGTGSGAIAVAVAVEARRRGFADELRLLATDPSADALALATENAVAHAVADMIDFARADLTDLPDRPTIDLLVANLPYIPSSLVPRLPVAASFEPRAALDGGEDGLEVIRRLMAQLPGVLAAEGKALLEIGAEQRVALEAAVERLLPGWSVAFHRDVSGLPRAAELTPGGGTSA